jgi:hypothetical protein
VFEWASDNPPRWLPDWLRPLADRTQVTPLPEPEAELAGAKRS